MGWKENRRRKRRWYKKFDAIAIALVARLGNPQATVTVADIVKLFYQFAIAHRLFKYNWIRESAAESLLLVAKDRALENILVVGKVRDGTRGPSPLASAYRDLAINDTIVKKTDRVYKMTEAPVYDKDIPPEQPEDRRANLLISGDWGPENSMPRPVTKPTKVVYLEEKTKPEQPF